MYNNQMGLVNSEQDVATLHFGAIQLSEIIPEMARHTGRIFPRQL